MFSAFKNKKKIILKLSIILNILIIVFTLLFFDYYKERKVNQYNELFANKNKEIRRIEKILSYYYHTNDNFIFKTKKNEITSKKRIKYVLNKINTNLYFSKKNGKSSAYIDIKDDFLYITSATGLFFRINLNDYESSIIKPKLIKSNIRNFIKDEQFFLKSDYGLKDILIDKSYIFVSFNNEIKDGCFNTGILRAKVNEEFLEFIKFFDHDECISAKTSKYKTFSVGQAGGRIVKFKNGYLLSHGSYSEFDEVQNSESIFGKILFIDKNGNLVKIYSKGHRNPQGLEIFNNDIIFETEHGPKGGDEINIIKEDKNYGWPIASYGSNYKGQKFMDKFYPLPNSHNKFEEPSKYFKNAIAISQILKVPKQFDNNDEDSLFLASMKINEDYGEKINLFQFKYKNNELKMHDILPIGERIRDLIYDKNNNKIIMFLDTSASIGVLSIN